MTLGSGSGIKRLLFGIEVTIVGGVLVLASSGGTADAAGLIVAFVGLLIALSGMVSEPQG